MAQKQDWESRLNNFYRLQYAWLLRIMNFLLISMACLFVYIVYLDYKRPWPRYYQSAADGSINRVYALSRPMVGTKALREWATLVAVQANTFNFSDYEKRLEEMEQYFTPDAWSVFLSSIDQANIVDDLVTKKLIISAVANGATVVTDQRMIGGQYTWRVQVPLLVSYRGGVQPYDQSLIINMLITRVPSRDVPKGIAVKQYFAQAATPGAAAAARDAAAGAATG